MSGPMERLTFGEELLFSEHPPLWRHRNKQVVYAIACPPGSTYQGLVTYSRWPAMELPETIDVDRGRHLVERREDVYDYAPTPDLPGAAEWHVNFADPSLFVAYGSSLMAQDEMQVAEHPVLGALREALDARGSAARTEERGVATPVLVVGATRRCRIATDRNAALGRPDGLYGNAFARADADTVRRATARIDPPTVTNLIAMAAPSGGRGEYSPETVHRILVTAYTGFRVAVLESVTLAGASTPVVVHSGYWGCGAFGGNRVLMALLQALAASAAGVERLVFHTVDSAGSRALDAALDALETLAANGPQRCTSDVVADTASLGFVWGVSDGN